MEPSEEIRRVIQRWLVATSESDAEAVLGRVSEHPGALTIGTDADEWWYGDQAHPVWRRQLEETGGFPLTWDEIEAWEEGTVGWAGARMTLDGPQESFETRGTWVLHLERGEWKVVQVHFPSERRTSRSWGWR